MSRRIAAVLVDLSGTLHIEDTVIPGAVEALNRLRSQHVKLKFVTNTTKESMSTLHRRLVELGFSIEKEEIFTSLTAARHLVEKRGLRPMYLLSDDALEDFQGIPTHDPNVVVVGLAPSLFHYEKLTEAFRLLLNGASLIAIHKARYYKRKDGLALGPGAFVSGLEYSAGVRAEVVGKPEKSFFLSALESLNVPPDAAVMVGDDAIDDVEGAMQAGLMGVLVRTGKYRPSDEAREVRPHHTANSFVEAVDYLIQNNL